MSKEKLNSQENSSKTAKKGDYVEIDYVGSTVDGVIFDTSIGIEADFEGVLDHERQYKPLKIVIGSHDMISALEDAFVGMAEGESKTIKVSPENAYGLHDDHKIREMHMDVLKKKKNLPIVGQQMVLTDNKSRAIPGRVVKVEKDNISIDFNHPLSGKDLIFTLKLRKIIRSKP